MYLGLQCDVRAELVENLNVMVTQFIVRGEMTAVDALRLPCLNLFAGSLQITHHYTEMVLQMNEIYDRCNRVEERMETFVNEHRRTCYP